MCYKNSNLTFNLLVFADPHVRVAGRRDGVKVAKERVMEVLDTRVIIQFLNSIECMYVCVKPSGCGTKIDCAWNFILCFVFLLWLTALQLDLFFWCISLLSFCIVRNSPTTYCCIQKRIKMTVKYYKYTRKMYI
jgi:hypothetical protein